MKLALLFDKYKCDKGNLGHNYDVIYEPILDSLKSKPFSLLEVGIFKGSSIEAFLEYAPNINILALDTFQRVDPMYIPILGHPNVKWLKYDSTSKAIKCNIKFDIIIDDGSHAHKDQCLTFKNLISNLKEDGVYFIEDVWPFNVMSEKEKKHYWLQKYPEKWNDKDYYELLNSISSYNVIYHDLRTGYEPDTYIIEIRKNV